MNIFIPYAVFALLFAIVVELRGLRAQISIIGILLLIGANVANYVTPSCNAGSKFDYMPQPQETCASSVLPNALAGAGYSIYSVVMLSQITYQTLPQITGTAYGFLFMIVNISKLVARILISQQYDSGIVDLSSFDVSYRPTMEQDFVNFWKNAASYLDDQSLVLIIASSCAIPFIIVSYLLDYF